MGRMSHLHENLPRKVFKGEFEPATFALNLSYKDVMLATELGREYQVPMPIANLAEQVAIEGMNRGWGDMDSTVTMILQEEAAGPGGALRQDRPRACRQVHHHQPRRLGRRPARSLLLKS